MSETSEEPRHDRATPDALSSVIVVGAVVGEPMQDTLRRLVASGDHGGAIALLMREHGDAVFTRAYRVLEDRHAAKDVLQQTFLDAYRDLETFAGRSSFKTWLMGIATHRALDAVRRRRREAQRTTSDDVLPEIADEAASDATAQVDKPRRVLALEECIKALSPEVRATLLMRFQEEMSYEEMAHVSKDRSGTLHARITRALPILRRCLEDKGITS